MNETKFTPGPWGVDDPADARGRLRRTVRERRELCNQWEIARVYAARHGAEQTDANARLIAAAPDLYEALLSLLNVEGAALSAAASLEAFKGLDVAYHFDKARAALLKAKATP